MIRSSLNVVRSLTARRPVHGRLLIVAAHPDDETIGCGVSMHHWMDVWVAHATDGAPADGRDARRHGFAGPAEYAACRRAEVERVLARAHVAPAKIIGLGCEDQCGARQLPALTDAIDDLLERVRPEVVVTHAYEGGHPDHDACAFAVARAVAQRRSGPPVVEMTGYHRGPAGFESAEFLPDPGSIVLTRRLTHAEQALKRQLLDLFTTQRGVLAPFRCDVERFRAAPRYDFTTPPHPGATYYDDFSWGMSSAEFCQAASAALRHELSSAERVAWTR